MLRFLVIPLAFALMLSACATPVPSDYNSVEEYEALLGDFAEQTRQLGARLVLISFPRRPDVEEQFPTLSEYSAALERFARERDLPLVDVRTAFRDRPEFERFFIDSVHLDRMGYRMVASVLERAIIEALKTPAP